MQQDSALVGRNKCPDSVFCSTNSRAHLEAELTSCVGSDFPLSFEDSLSYKASHQRNSEIHPDAALDQSCTPELHSNRQRYLRVMVNDIHQFRPTHNAQIYNNTAPKHSHAQPNTCCCPVRLESTSSDQN